MKKRSCLTLFILLLGILFSVSATAAENGACRHAYSDICDTDCNICGAVRSTHAEHSWISSCATRCSNCGSVREAEDEHVYSICGAQCLLCDAARAPEDIPHTYTHACSEACFFCGTRRTDHEPHSYIDGCDTNCLLCNAERTEGFSHVFHAPCATACKECEASLVPNIEHTFSADCDTKCDACGESCERNGAPDHTYVADCATVCSSCKTSRLAPANHRIVMKTEGENSVPYCEQCGMVLISNATVGDSGAIYYFNGDNSLSGNIIRVETMPLEDTEIADINPMDVLSQFGCNAALGTSATVSVWTLLAAICMLKKEKED